jgi:hypothetical protein
MIIARARRLDATCCGGHDFAADLNEQKGATFRVLFAAAS